MPLPSDPNSSWPPKPYAPHAAEVDEAAAWFAGSEADLARFYQGATSATVTPDETRFFWSRRDRSTRTSVNANRMHAGVASDVATVASDLLFGDDVRIVIPEAHGETEDPEAAACEERLVELLEEEGADSMLLDAAEVASGLGGAYVRVVWDHDLEPEHPMLDVVHPDRAVPEFRFNRLTAVTLWREIDGDEKGVVRHLERYEGDRIEHGVFVGSATELGKRIPLAKWPTVGMAGIAESVDDDGVIMVPGGANPISWIPNAKNRRHRSAPWGRSDCAGTERFMDAIDEVWSAWMREIRLGKLRVIVPAEFLERPVGGPGGGQDWDRDREVFSPVKVDPMSTTKTIEQVAFDLRVEKYGATVGELLEVIVRSAGYSPQSFGMAGDGHDQTATEVDARKDRSVRTTLRKRRHYQRGVSHALEALLIVDAAEFGSKVKPMRPQLVFPDPNETSMRERASTLNLVNLAGAASVETMVRMLNPTWGEQQVQAETARIITERGTPPDPTGFGGMGG